MWLAITLCLSAVTGALRAYGAQLHISGLWAGKALAPTGSDSLMPTGFQDALTHGWPSTVSFVSTIAPAGVLVTGLLHAWWAALLGLALMIAVSAALRGTRLIPGTVDRYLLLLLARLSRREADYRRESDLERADAAAALRLELQRLIEDYLDSGVRVPTFGEVQKWPNGDRTSLKAAPTPMAV